MPSLCSCFKLSKMRKTLRVIRLFVTFLVVTETTRRSKAVYAHLCPWLTRPLRSRLCVDQTLWCSTLGCQHFDPLPVRPTAALRLSHYPRQDSPSRFIPAISALWSIFMNCITTLLNGDSWRAVESGSPSIVHPSADLLNRWF